MKTRTLRLVLAIFAAGLGGACTAPIQSHGEYLQSAPFSSFRTFGFVPSEAPPEGYQASDRSAQIAEQMRPMVAAVLQEKGYVFAPNGDADIMVECSAGRRPGLHAHRKEWRMSAVTGEAREEREDVEGGIVIDAFDRSGGQIWHGSARSEIDPQKPSVDRLRRAVAAALSKFPARPELR